jgi:phosphate acyltransferase
MIRVALDAMGGDHAPIEVVKGGLMALAEVTDLHLSLVGPEDVLKKILIGQSYPAERLEIIHASEKILADDAPVLAVRRKKDSSMMTAIRMVKEGQANAAVSAGNTGALMAGGLLMAGRLGVIERPALTVVAPTFNGGNAVLLDVGANMDAKAEHLYDYAVMGNIYAREVLQKSAPRVGLLNVGTEDNKGNDQVRKAYELLRGRLDNFCGNVEARDVLNGAADVVVCDGFVGNILLKTIEGLSSAIFAAMKEAFTANLKSKMAAALLMPELKGMKKRLDYAEYGGAPLLGLNGVIIKSHGSSNARAIRSAIVTQACRFSRQDVNGQIQKALAPKEE